ncbi:MAG: hypothetical protein A2Y16_05305 [Tenericutes bacterium GWF2_57_13]|nr:MAG: hypothetical protein A2Y16_05305 [Tenericutes bacterium GWF2_57_13]
MSLSKNIHKQQPQFVTIEYLLKAEKLTVPNYQRSYNWKTEQVDDFVESIRDLCKNNFHDDLGAINEFENYFGPVMINGSKRPHEIIDGQQRIATFILFLYTIKRTLQDEINKSAATAKYSGESIDAAQDFVRRIEGTIAQSTFPKPGKKTEKNYLFVPFQERDRRALKAILENQDVKKYKSTRLVKNYEILRQRLKALLQEDFFKKYDYQELDRLVFMAGQILENTYVLRTELSDISSAFAIFESLNNTGLQLTPFDLLNGYVMSECTSNITDDWKRMIADVRDKDIPVEDYTYYWWQSKGYDTPKINLYNEIKQLMSTEGNDKIAQELMNCIEDLDEYLSDNTYLKKYLSLLQRKRIIPLYIAMKENSYSSTNIDEIMRFALTYSIIELNLLGKSPGVFQYRLKKILNLISGTKSLAIKKVKSEIREIQLDFESYDTDTVFGNLRNGGLQDDQLYKTLLLMLMENENKGILPDFDNIDLEHLFPQNPSESWYDHAEWVPMRDEDKQNKYIHALGNVVLIDSKLNRKIKNKYILEKAADIERTLSSCDFLKTVAWNKIEYASFTPEYIDARTETLIERIVTSKVLGF